MRLQYEVFGHIGRGILVPPIMSFILLLQFSLIEKRLIHTKISACYKYYLTAQVKFNPCNHAPLTSYRGYVNKTMHYNPSTLQI